MVADNVLLFAIVAAVLLFHKSCLNNLFAACYFNIINTCGPLLHGYTALAGGRFYIIHQLPITVIALQAQHGLPVLYIYHCCCGVGP